MSLALTLTGAGAATDEIRLRVFAAASLAEALQQIAADYQRTHGVTIELNLAASSTLARQIEEGAPADLFLSADEAKMDGLERQHLLLPGTRRELLSNTLVVVVPRDSALVIDRPEGLAGAGVKALALAEPQTVPAGIYAKSWLVSQGLWSRVSGRVVPTENVRGALAAVEAGNADAAIVYRTDARIATRSRIAYEVPTAAGPRIVYPLAVLVAAPAPAAARAFHAYLGSAAALAVFRDHGFLVLDQPRP